jgi:FkbM family methyltransferase
LAADPARGLTILVPASRRRGYRRGHHERPVLDLLAEKLAPGMQFVDAGAFLGYFTLAAAARVGRQGRVWAFEPCAESRRLLERSVRRNDLTNVTVVPRALGARAGEGRLTRPPNRSMARLMSPEAGRYETERVAVTTLDAWCAETGARPDVVKIDVEGRELELLEGAAETLRRDRPLLVIEAHRSPFFAATPEDLIEWLRSASYRVRPLAAEQAGDLSGALERLAAMPLPADRVGVLHLLATARPTVDRSS